MRDDIGMAVIQYIMDAGLITSVNYLPDEGQVEIIWSAGAADQVDAFIWDKLIVEKGY